MRKLLRAEWVLLGVALVVPLVDLLLEAVGLSEWILGNPEVPIRIVLLGLSGPIEVNGATINSIMPPPPGLDDAQIAEAITYARTHFGNNASKVTADQVKQVRAALAGRTESFKAEELKPLLGAGEAAPAAAPGTAGAPAEGAAGAAGAPEQGAAPAGGAAARGRTARRPRSTGASTRSARVGTFRSSASTGRRGT